MSHPNLIQTLREYRPLLLACEAIGWLHMAGKAKVDFLRSHGGQGDYDYKRWYEQETPPFPWDNLLMWVRENFDLKKDFSLQNDPWPGTLTDFLTKHTERNRGILGLLQAGHAMASGIEKNLPRATSEYLSQNATHMWLSTAFGHPVRNLLVDPPELLTETGWERLLEQIEGLLTELKRLGDQGLSNDLDGWWRWRENAVGPDGWLREAFTSTLAETRLPNNDVTLFDQSYVAAALFKSAVAGAILEGNSFPWNYSGIKQQTRWRLLTVGISVDHYESRAVKIGDWTGTRLALGEFFNRVRKLVEVDLAVGSLLYADRGVCVFSFPGERFDNDRDDLQIEEWKKWLRNQAGCFAAEVKLETPPYCNISEPSRSLVRMTAEIREAKDKMVVPLFHNWEIPDVDSSAEGHVCPVCLVRRSGDESSKQTPCKPCRDRRIGRLEAWLSGELGTDTIWITEVADTNDRLALITMSLDIEPWLDGTRLDSLRTQAIPEWRKFNPELYEFRKRDEEKKREPNPIDPNKPFSSLSQHVEKKLPSFDKNDLVLSNLQEGYRHERDWKSFFSKIVEDRAKTPEWENLDKSGRAIWLTHQLFRKLASPGRIYRFQRQAEDFFRGLLAEFREIAAEDRNRWRIRRLVITPDENSSDSWEDRHTYNGRYGDAPVSLLFRKETGDFLTICNLARLLKPEQGKDSLEGITLELKADDREWGKQTEKLKVGSVSDDVGKLGCYHPIIPLELSPVRFRVLVPLEAASECVDRTIEAWNDQFARVWDRMPLRIGIVAFPRMMPFQAVIEATRNIETNLTANRNIPETWRVEQSETREGVVAVDFVRSDGQRELRTIPIELPDGREDVFYPYIRVQDQKVRYPYDFQHPEGQVYRHVRDLRTGDGVFVEESRIACVFLDTTARRFEPANVRPLAEFQRMRRVWELLARSAPSTTALRGACTELEERQRSWRGPDGNWLEGAQEEWIALAQAILRDRLQVNGAVLQILVAATRDGVFGWALEWHLHWLKQHLEEVGA